jgi:uncharacterized protein
MKLPKRWIDLISISFLLIPVSSVTMPAFLLSQEAESVESIAKTLKHDWIGALEVGQNKLKLGLHFKRDTNGNWSGTMDSPDQGAFGIPMDDVSLEGNEVRFEIKRVQAAFDGIVSTNPNSIEGTWTQGIAIKVKMIVDEDYSEDKITPDARPRPQTPKGPFEYASEEVVINNESAKVRLAGTLTLPKGNEPFPAIVLITGSGAQNRDEEIEGHRIFFVIADHLTQRGIAVLRYDDRGCGASTGVFGTSTTMDFASDAIAAIEYLKTRSDIDASRIGLLGHSEGGLIAPIAAVKSRGIAFIVLMAGPGVNGEQVLYQQSNRIIASNGGSEDVIKENRLVQQEMFNAVKSAADEATARSALMKLMLAKEAKHKQDGWTPEKIEVWKQNFIADCEGVNTPWFRMFLTLEPSNWLKQVKSPVLAINGESDTQVDADQNLTAIENALKIGDHKDFTMKRLPGLNHQFQTCKTGSPNEYGNIQETIAPLALETIASWVISKTSKTPDQSDES